MAGEPLALPSVEKRGNSEYSSGRAAGQLLLCGVNSQQRVKVTNPAPVLGSSFWSLRLGTEQHELPKIQYGLLQRKIYELCTKTTINPIPQTVLNALGMLQIAIDTINRLKGDAAVRRAHSGPVVVLWFTIAPKSTSTVSRIGSLGKCPDRSRNTAGLRIIEMVSGQHFPAALQWGPGSSESAPHHRPSDHRHKNKRRRRR